VFVEFHEFIIAGGGAKGIRWNGGGADGYNGVVEEQESGAGWLDGGRTGLE
jgi:hypothetical protein